LRSRRLSFNLYPSEVPNLGSWEAALEAVKAGKADAIAGIFVTEERKTWAELITPAYLDNSISVIVATRFESCRIRENEGWPTDEV